MPLRIRKEAKMPKCVLCKNEIDAQRHPATGEVYWTKGHNAYPLAEGQCCSTCNDTKVMSARFERIYDCRKL